MDENIWLCGDEDEGSEPEDYEPPADSSNGSDEGQDECGCGEDGTGFSSVRFRVSLGEPSRNKTSGYLWFCEDKPRRVDFSMFQLDSSAGISVSTNAGIVTIANSDSFGRTLDMEKIVHGVSVSVFDYSGELEHKWIVENPAGETNTFRIAKMSRKGNAISDETFSVEEDEVLKNWY